MIYGILIGLIIIVPIAIAYYYDYKSDPKEFTFSVKTLGKGLLKGLVYIAIFIGLNAVYKLVIPFNKNHGIEFNSEREKLGIPKIGDSWENRKYDSDQFTTKWWNTESTDAHFKKVIEYGVSNAVSETDYFKNENKKYIYVSSKYRFDDRTFEYFIEKQGQTSKISETEFEKFIKE
tara:strand:+ start:941 stop:1468 length:528 start_codon:yes stop_codon:yes gene_type:complete